MSLGDVSHILETYQCTAVYGINRRMYVSIYVVLSAGNNNHFNYSMLPSGSHTKFWRHVLGAHHKKYSPRSKLINNLSNWHCSILRIVATKTM